MQSFRMKIVCLALVFLCSAVVTQGSPLIVPDRATMALDELGFYQPGYRLRGGSETFLPVGWTSGLDSPTGAACQDAGIQNGQNAWLLHCPWHDKTGVTFQDFTVALPSLPKITLRGSTALRSDAVGKSDGVTYRIFVNGEKRFEVNRMDGEWQPFEIDLTANAGRTVTLRFETDPGPRDNASFDFALWGNRQLELPGLMTSTLPHPNLPTLNLRQISSRQNGSVVPLSGFAGKTEVHVSPSEAILSYVGKDGTLEYRWKPDQSDSLLGNLILRAKMIADDPVEIPLAEQSTLEWIVAARLAQSHLSSNTTITGETQAVLTRTYTVDDQKAVVTIVGTLQGKSLVFDVTCDRPIVRVLEGGGWGPVFRRKSLAAPYYSWPISFFSRENLFAGAFLDWTSSAASGQEKTRAVYNARTDGSLNPLHERLIYTAAWHLDETFPNIPNPPSPYREDLSKRVILDIWGGSFTNIQARLRALAEGGFGPGMAIIHDWQFGGYDNKLPQHVPANPKLGGDPAMTVLIQEGEHADIHVALHENYVDDYPNSPDYADADIALNPDGSKAPAWFNPGTKIQSFAVKPTREVPLAKTQGVEILRRYGTGASYLDVHSAVPPWFHVDAEAGIPEAGQFRPVWNVHRALWTYERELHGGPVFGEGNNHWYWSGALDGVEAQFGQGWRDGNGMNAPLLVDFDLLKIHPLQLNHGMGYYERWWPHGPDAKRGLLSFLDRYRMQEAAYGHEAFLGGEAWHDPRCAWLESHLIPPLITRTALAQSTAIDYWVNGRWLDTSSAAKEKTDWSQVRIRYDNGLTIWANGSQDQSLSVGELILPPSGWLAQGAGLTAGSTLRQGRWTDLADTAESVFVNARPALDWQDRETGHIKPSVAQFTSAAPRAFRATYQWQVGQSPAQELRCFVHFVSTRDDSASEHLSFQQDHSLEVATSRWQPGQTLDDGPWNITIPDTVATGDYLWTIGLYNDEVGRLTLQGPSDSHRRRILGILHLATDGAVTFTPALPEPQDTAPVNRDVPIIDFGSIRTDGSVFVRREGDHWILRPFPTDRPFTVELNAARFGHPVATPVVDGWWRLPLTGERSYRWPAPE